MLVASSKVSPDSFGAEIKRRNSRDLLQRYFSPRHVMPFKPLVDQFATDVKTVAREAGRFVFHKPVTTGWRVGSHLRACAGTGKLFVLTFSPNVKCAR